MDTQVKVTQEPYLQTGMYRIPTQEGTPSDAFLQGPWWQANAEDTEASSIVEYTIIWKTETEDQPASWANPTYIIARGDVSIDITGQAELLPNEFISF